MKIFERNGLEIRPGDRYKGVFDVSISILKDNRLFLSCAANYSNIKEIEEAFMFFNTDIVVYNPEINNWTEYSIELMQNNDMIKKIFVDILRALGTGAKDVKAKLEKIKLADVPQELQLPDALKSLLQMICPIIDILNKGKLLICDELEAGLHESVIGGIKCGLHN